MGGGSFSQSLRCSGLSPKNSLMKSFYPLLLLLLLRYNQIFLLFRHNQIYLQIFKNDVPSL